MARDIDTEHMAGEAIQLGTVASVDHANATCTVQLGDLVTGELPWVAQRAGGARRWSPPTVGEQCVLLAPEGDVENGLVMLGLYSDAFPPPSNNPDVIATEYPDGAVISYNHATHLLTITLPPGGAIAIEADGGTSIKGPVAIDGDLTIAGKAIASVDLIGGGISLKDHKHGNVQAGGAQTGAPV